MPGFPGLLETIYVQERMIELLMPDVFTAFVRIFSLFLVGSLILKAMLTEKAYDLLHCLRDEMVYHSICKYRALSNAITTLGRVLARG
jgi:hypothetical protein